MIENNLVEAILVLPRNLFYTTDFSVTLWLLNKNKKSHSKTVGDEKRQFRNREKEILFMDLRQMGEPFEKKFTQFGGADIKKIAGTYHQWQQKEIENIPEYCYAAKLEEIQAKDFSLVPSKYIEFVNRDENIDFDEKECKQDLLTVFKELGYEIKL